MIKINFEDVFQSLRSFFENNQKEIAVGVGFGVGVGFTGVCVKAIKNNYVLEAGSKDSYIKMAPAETIEKLSSVDK